MSPGEQEPEGHLGQLPRPGSRGSIQESRSASAHPGDGDDGPQAWGLDHTGQAVSWCTRGRLDRATNAQSPRSPSALPVSDGGDGSSGGKDGNPGHVHMGPVSPHPAPRPTTTDVGLRGGMSPPTSASRTTSSSVSCIASGPNQEFQGQEPGPTSHVPQPSHGAPVGILFQFKENLNQIYYPNY